MSLPVLQWGFLAIAFLLANLPWLSQRCFLILQCEKKSAWMRLVEWFALYFVVGIMALLLEQRAMGAAHAQDWEFYAVTLSLFLVFAFPGFIYRYAR
ncbi:MAG: DUF2818 family protein [Gammaproteobacteria bacterium]|nr:DUF2818 family protein [Gammaproteobacteria bacterium]MBU1722784.1 DUF2818 family protein [Gammaproteobacteria bacterium]MBU2005189.1 DUF2818 family protein [Gammaproteobacteria bacterium]